MGSDGLYTRLTNPSFRTFPFLVLNLHRHPKFLSLQEGYVVYLCLILAFSQPVRDSVAWMCQVLYHLLICFLASELVLTLSSFLFFLLVGLCRNKNSFTVMFLEFGKGLKNVGTCIQSFIFICLEIVVSPHIPIPKSGLGFCLFVSFKKGKNKSKIFPTYIIFHILFLNLIF